MRFALLGADADSLWLARALAAGGQHQLTLAIDVGAAAAELANWAPRLEIDDRWETLLHGAEVDAVIVATGHREQRADQLRKLVQERSPTIVAQGAVESIVGYELEMIRHDVGAVIVPFSRRWLHPVVRHLRRWLAEPAAGLGSVEQFSLERGFATAARPAILQELAVDIELLRRLAGGRVQRVTALGALDGPTVNLQVTLATPEGLYLRWTAHGARGEAAAARLTVQGASGEATLTLPSDAPWRLEHAGQTLAEAAADAVDEDALAELLAALAPPPRERGAVGGPWHDACRSCEAAEVAEISLRRGRTIELHNEEVTQRETFKGVMAAGGCFLLLFGLLGLLLASVVEGLELPFRQHILWRLWPVYIAVPLVFFMLLQLLQLAIRRERTGDSADGGPPSAPADDHR